MTCAGQPVASHAAVVFFLVSGLSERSQPDDHVARTDVRIVDHVGAFHAAGNRTVDDDGTDQVAYIGRFAACSIAADSHFAKFGQQFVCSVDDGGDHFTRNQQLVASDGGGYQYVVYGTHAQQVVDIHYQSILRDTFPYGQVSCLFPVQVSQRGLGSGSVGMHDVAIFGIASQDIGNDLTECLGKDSLVDVLYRVMNIFFRSGYTA